MQKSEYIHQSIPWFHGQSDYHDSSEREPINSGEEKAPNTAEFVFLRPDLYFFQAKRLRHFFLTLYTNIRCHRRGLYYTYEARIAKMASFMVMGFRSDQKARSGNRRVDSRASYITVADDVSFSTRKGCGYVGSVVSLRYFSDLRVYLSRV
jgi:hypothetical protein